MSLNSACGQCDGVPGWRITRRGDVVISWACDEHLAAECEAKRRIVDLHALARTMGHQCVAIDGPTQHHMADPCATLRLLAMPYADHPDYREEWRP